MTPLPPTNAAHISASSLLSLASCAMLLGLSACQVPTEALKTPPIFTRPAPQNASDASGAGPAGRAEDFSAKATSLDDFIKSAGTDIVTFGPNSAQLDLDAKAILERQANWLRARPFVAIVIEGHTDERVTVAQAFALAEQRASAVRRYFLGKGIAASRIRVLAFGKSRPRAQGSDESAWKQNRRAQVITIIDPS